MSKPIEEIDVTKPGVVESALFDPRNEEIRADPWALCRRLREMDPVFESPFGFFMVTGYDACVEALRDPRLSVDPRNATSLARMSGVGPAQRGLDHMMLFTDPPDHTRLRMLVTKAFSPRVVNALQARITEIVTGLVEELERSDEPDLIAGLAYPLPVTVICDMLGVPVQDRAGLRGWSTGIAPVLDPFVPPDNYEAMVRAGAELVSYIHDLIEERRADLGDDLLSELIRTEEEGERLTTEELRATCILLLIAGHETTMNLLGNGIYALLRDREQWESLLAEPSLIASGVEELLRHDGPALLTARYAREDVELAGQTVRAGRIVLVLMAAGNRDPAAFPDPDRLDVARSPNKHLGFGAGPHFCVGATLARTEARIALRVLAHRAPRLALRGDPRWRATVTFRGLESLPVSL